MAASKLWASMTVLAVGASCSKLHTRAYADAPFRFNPFSVPPSPQVNHPSNAKAEVNSEAEEARGSGFDPEALERGAKALREINNSPRAKQVFDVMRTQEQTRLAELSAKKAHYEAIQAKADIDRQHKLAEEQRNLVQRQAQTKAQSLRYDDELARKRMQTDHETQRKNNVELVKMQEESSIRKEQSRRATEEQIQAQQRQTEKERAEIEQETIRVKAMAEAEGRAHEAKLTEDHNRKMLIERLNGEKEKWLAAINTTFGHIEDHIYTQVMGPERHGRVQSYGFGITPTLLFGSSSTRQSRSTLSTQLENAQEMLRVAEQKCTVATKIFEEKLVEVQRKTREEVKEEFDRKFMEMQRVQAKLREEMMQMRQKFQEK